MWFGACYLLICYKEKKRKADWAYSHLIFLAWKFPKSNSTHLTGNLVLSQDLKGLWGPGQEHRWEKWAEGRLGWNGNNVFCPQRLKIPQLQPHDWPWECRHSVATILPFFKWSRFFFMTFRCQSHMFGCWIGPKIVSLWFSRKGNKLEIRSKTTKSLQSCLTLCDPRRLLGPWDSPGQNIRVGCQALLQGIFQTQESNLRLLCLLHWQVDS